jgi:PKD repeat protein
MYRFFISLALLFSAYCMYAQPDGFHWKDGVCDSPIEQLTVDNQGVLWGVGYLVAPQIGDPFLIARNSSDGQVLGSVSACAITITPSVSSSGIISLEVLNCNSNNNQFRIARYTASSAGINLQANTATHSLASMSNGTLAGYFIQSTGISGGSNFYYVTINCRNNSGQYRVLAIQFGFNGNIISSTVFGNAAGGQHLLEDLGSVVLNSGKILAYSKEYNPAQLTIDYVVELRDPAPIAGSELLVVNYVPTAIDNIHVIESNIEGNESNGIFIYINLHDLDPGNNPLGFMDSEIDQVIINGNNLNYNLVSFTNNDFIEAISPANGSIYSISGPTGFLVSYQAPTAILSKLDLNGNLQWKRYLGAAAGFDVAQDVLFDNGNIYTSIVSSDHSGDLVGIDYSGCGLQYGYSWLSRLGFDNCCQCFNYTCEPADDGFGTVYFDNQYQPTGEESWYEIEATNVNTGAIEVIHNSGDYPAFLSYSLTPGWYRICFVVYGDQNASKRTSIPIYECCLYVYVPDNCEENDDDFTPTIIASQQSGNTWVFESPEAGDNATYQWVFDDGGYSEVQDTGQITTYEFNQSGWHKICCIVSSIHGQYRYCKRIYISPGDHPGPECYEPDPGMDFTPTITVGENNNVSIAAASGYSYVIDYGDGSAPTHSSTHTYPSNPNRTTYIICIKYYYNDCYYGCFCYTVLIEPCCQDFYHYDCDWIDWYLSFPFNGGGEFTFSNNSDKTVEAWYVNNIEVGSGNELQYVFNYNDSPVDICFAYYDDDGCLHYCCINFCLYDPFSCDNVNIVQDDDLFILSVDQVDSDVDPVWYLHLNGSDILLPQTGSSIELDPSLYAIGTNETVVISVRYKDVFGCYRYCCIEYCFYCNFCDDIEILPYPASDNSHLAFDIDMGDVAYILVTNPDQSIDSIVTNQFYCPIPGTYEFCFYFWVNGQLQWCCKEYCINDYWLCGDIDLVYTATNNPYEYVIQSCGTDNAFFVIDDEQLFANSGNDLIHTFPGPGLYPVCCYYFDPVCGTYYSCCTYVCIPQWVPYSDCPPVNDPPFTPTITIDTANLEVTLNSNGINDISWTIYEDGDSSTIDVSDTTITLNQSTATICYYYYDNSSEVANACCWTLCLYPVQSEACFNLRYAGGLDRVFVIDPDIMPLYYEVYDEQDEFLFKISGELDRYRFPAEGRYRICLVGLNPCCAYTYCCLDVCIYDPYDCDSYEYVPTDVNNPLMYSFTVIPDATNIVWYRDFPDGNQLELGTGNDFELDFTSLDGAGEYYITVSYYDPIEGCEIVCCRRICIYNPFNCQDITWTSNPTQNTLTEYTFTLNQSEASNQSWYLHLQNADVLIGESSNSINVVFSNWLSTNGEYDISVRYFDGTCWRFCCIRICIIADPVNLDFTTTINEQNVAFQSLTNASNATIRWNFGDGNTSAHLNPNHTYAVPGSYTVCCTLSICGLEVIVCKDIQIDSDLPDLRWGHVAANNGQTFAIPLIYEGPAIMLQGFSVFYDFQQEQDIDIYDWEPVAISQSVNVILDHPTATRGNILKIFPAEQLNTGDTLFRLIGEVTTSLQKVIEFEFDDETGYSTKLLDDNGAEILLDLINGEISLNLQTSTSGHVTTIDNKGIGRVRAGSTTSTGNSIAVQSNASGYYQFNSALDYVDGEINLSKADDWRNGLSVVQISRIVAHLNKTNLLEHPYFLIAADFNCDGQLDISDAIQMYLSLFGSLSGPGCATWQFIPRDYQFTDPEQPYDFESAAYLQDYAPEEDIDFVGIKKGDVLLQANTRSSDELHLYSTNSIYSGNEFQVPIFSETFFDIKSFQIGLVFDTIKVASISLDDNARVFGQDIQAIRNGNVLEIGWVDFQFSDTARYLENDQELFKINIVLKNGVENFNPINGLRLSESFNNIASNSNFEYFPVTFDYFSSTRNDKVAETEVIVFPNPFTDEILISLDGVEYGKEVHVMISNMSGNTVYQSNELINSNNLSVNTTELVPGVYVLNIRTRAMNYTELLIRSN